MDAFPSPGLHSGLHWAPGPHASAFQQLGQHRGLVPTGLPLSPGGSMNPGR